MRGNSLTAPTDVAEILQSPTIEGIEREIAWLLTQHVAFQSRDCAPTERIAALLTASESLAYPRGIGWALTFRAVCQRSNSDFQAAKTDWERGLTVAREAADVTLEAECLHGLGVVARIQQDYAVAFELLFRELALRHQVNDGAGELRAYNSIALTHTHLGNYADALECYQHSLERAQALDDFQAEVWVRSNLGGLKILLGDTEDALEGLLHARLLSRRLPADAVPVTLSIRLAEAYIQAGEYVKAEDALREATERIAERGNRNGSIRAGTAHAALLIATGRPEQAEVVLKDALAQSQETTEFLSRPLILLQLGKVAQQRGKPEETLRWYREGLDFAERAGVPRFLSLFHKAFADYYRDERDFEQALTHYERYHQAEEASQRLYATIQLTAWNARAALEHAETERDAAFREAERERVRSAELARTNQRLEDANRENARLLAQLERHAAHLSHQANRDPLTGLYNRRFLDAVLEQEIGMARRRQVALPLAIADLDNFKHVNDHFSHQIGDVVLKTTADIFARCASGGDILARYGGEEFVIALPDSDADRVREICEGVRRAVAEYPWDDVHPGLRVTISIGVCTEATATPAEALALADQRLYQAKHDGKNRVCFA